MERRQGALAPAVASLLLITLGAPFLVGQSRTFEG